MITTEVREHPLLFSAPMVRAILSGRKTQTRRLVAGVTPDHRDPHQFTEPHELVFSGPTPAIVTVRFHVGDRLWVRETWQAWSRASIEYDEWDPITREFRMGESWAEWIELHGKPDAIEYQADSESTGPWTPSIHMPRWASRITLEITEVRVQRLHDITEEDARAEGVTTLGASMRATRGFEMLWDSINGKRAPWASNPWVWALTFRRLP